MTFSIKKEELNWTKAAELLEQLYDLMLSFIRHLNILKPCI